MSTGGEMGRPVVHVEIIGRDPERLRAFYAALFDWTTETDAAVAPEVSDAGEYGFLPPPDGAPAVAGGIGGGPAHTPHTVFYIGVDEVAATLQRAVELGASAVMGPVARPDGALVVAHLADPEGNVIGLAGPS